MRFKLCALLLFAVRFLQADVAPSAIREFPIRFKEGLLWLEVNVPHRKEPLHFLLDSGASVGVVNLATARQLGLKLGPKVSVTGVRTTLSGNWPVKLSAVTSQLPLPGEYLALDLSKLSGACSRSVDGLIGADFFRDRIVRIDYAAQKVRLLETVPALSGETVVPLEGRRCGFRVPVNVNGGETQWVRLDTGCATAFQWVTSKEPTEGCASKLAVGLTEFSIPQTLTGVRLGKHYFDTVPTGLHRKAIFPGESGLLGNGLLAQFGVVTIDAKVGRLILGPIAVH